MPTTPTQLCRRLAIVSLSNAVAYKPVYPAVRILGSAPLCRSAQLGSAAAEERLSEGTDLCPYRPGGTTIHGGRHHCDGGMASSGRVTRPAPYRSRLPASPFRATRGAQFGST